MFAHDAETNFQHPAARAALAMRNEVAAEMSVAGRAGLMPAERCWGDASVALLEPGDTAWVVASDEFARMREDLAAEGVIEVSPDSPVGLHLAAIGGLAVPVGAAAAADGDGAGASGGVRGLVARARGLWASGRQPPSCDRPRPQARRRRERMETALWFVVGCAGGLALAVAVRALEMVVAWL